MIARAETLAQSLRHSAIVYLEPFREQHHVGIVHRADGGPVLVLHLAWHRDLRNESVDDLNAPAVWIEPSLPAARLRAIAAYGRLVAEASGRFIPYGFNHPRGALSAEGKCLLTQSGEGLTCATFVLAIFDVCGWPLVNYDDWPTDRPEDRQWRDRIMKLLAERRDSNAKQHANDLLREPPATRFRPEEVAGAALSDSPVSFKTAASNAARLRVFYLEGPATDPGTEPHASAVNDP